MSDEKYDEKSGEGTNPGIPPNSATPPPSEPIGANPVDANPSAAVFSGYPVRRHGGFSGALFGICIVLLGVLFLLQNLGFFYVGQIWQLWPVILIAMGLSRLIGSGNLPSSMGGLILTVVGSVFLLSNLGYVTPHVWRYIWPFALIVWGLMIMIGGPKWRSQRRFDRAQRRWQRHQRHQYQNWTNPWERPNTWTSPQGASSQWSGNVSGGFASSTSNMANRLHEYAILGGVRRRVDSQEFEGGDATAVMGGVELDLRGAGTKLDEVVIEANALMGGIEIAVPQDWEVVVQGVGILGGYDDGTHPPAVPPANGVKRPRLVITGQALFGGVHVKN